MTVRDSIRRSIVGSARHRFARSANELLDHGQCRGRNHGRSSIRAGDGPPSRDLGRCVTRAPAQWSRPPNAAYGIAHETEAAGSLALEASLSLSRIRGLTCEILAHAPTPSIPLRVRSRRPPLASPSSLAPSFGISPMRSLLLFIAVSLPLSLSVHLSLSRSLWSFLVQLYPRPFALHPLVPTGAANYRSSLFVFRRRPASSLLPLPFLSHLPSVWLLNHEATSVWRRACTRGKEVFHEVSAGVSRDSQLWKRVVSLIGPSLLFGERSISRR